MISATSLGLSNANMLLGLTPVTTAPATPALNADSQLLNDMGLGPTGGSAASALDSLLSSYESYLATPASARVDIVA